MADAVASVASMRFAARRLSAGGRAGLAGAQQLGLMFDVFETVIGGDLAAPIGECAVVNLDDAAAFAAGQVMVMTGATGAVGGLPVRAANRVDVALVCEPAQVAVDGRQADTAQLVVQFLRGQRAVTARKLSEDRAALLGAASGCLVWGHVVLVWDHVVMEGRRWATRHPY